MEDNQNNDQEFLDFDFKLLLVDRNKKRVDNLKYILDGLYLTKVVNSVEKAIEYLNNNENDLPDLILIMSDFLTSENDLSTSSAQMTSIDLCNFIRNNEEIKINSIPIIVILKHANKQQELQFFNLGVGDVIHIPYDILDLFARIELQLERVIEKKKLLDSLEGLMQEQKTRNKKNIDFRTKLVSKHKETIAFYEEKIKRLREMLSTKKHELEKAKIIIEELRKENQVLFNKVNNFENLKSNTKKIKVKSSKFSIPDEELDLLEEIFHVINEEYLFENQIIKQISEQILQDEVDFKEIDNLFFINNIKQIIKKRLQFEVRKIYQNCKKEDIKENIKNKFNIFVEYILKTYLHKFLFMFAMQLLQDIANKNENAIKFLKFYDGRVEIDSNGVRYEKPLIGGKNGSWNMISMIQVINQRANGQKIIIEQENEINSVNHELEQIEAKFNQLANSINNLLTEDLKKEKPLEEKFKILYNAFIELRNKPDNNISQITEIDDKLSELEDLRNEFLKYSSIKDNLVAKHTKQIAYYKPTEEKFMKVALEVAKVMLKVKIIN